MKSKPKNKDATMGFEPASNNEPDLFVELGKKFELLGKALQNKDSLLRDLSDRARDCGLHLRFGLEDKDKPTVSVVNLREECDRLIIAEKELQDLAASALHELAILKAITGIVRASWNKDGVLSILTHGSSSPYSPKNADAPR